MTAELRHHKEFPAGAINRTSACTWCPSSIRSVCNRTAGDTLSLCTSEAKTKGLTSPVDYYFFDPQLYITWRLTK